MKRLLLVRHGETEWNARYILQGQEDIGLSGTGRRQVAAIAPLVRELSPDGAVSSDLARARETARLLGFSDPSIASAWREADLGSWQGRSKREIDPAAYRAWRDGCHDPPGGEGWEPFRTRIGAALAALPAEGTTVVVTHGGVIRAALSILIGLGPDRIIPVEPASVTVIDLDGLARLKAFNVTREFSTEDPPD